MFSLLLFSVWRLWSHSTRPFVFCYFSAAFFTVPACINVSRPPHRLLIYESYPGLSLLSPVGGIDVESITGRIASCPQISWILFWQPVASSAPDFYETLEDNILKCCMTFFFHSVCWIIFLIEAMFRCSCKCTQPSSPHVIRLSGLLIWDK